MKVRRRRSIIEVGLGGCLLRKGVVAVEDHGIWEVIRTRSNKAYFIYNPLALGTRSAASCGEILAPPRPPHLSKSFVVIFNSIGTLA